VVGLEHPSARRHVEMVAMPGRGIIRIRIKIVSAAVRPPAFVPKNLDNLRWKV